MRLTVVRSLETEGYGAATYNSRVVALLADRIPDGVRDIEVGPLRARHHRGRHLPAGVTARLPLTGARALGASLWGAGPVHRMDVRLPPARHEVVTVLDLAPHHFADEGTIPSFSLASVAHARGVICLSAFVAREATELLGARRTWVAPPGVDERFFTACPLSRDERTQLGLPPGRYLLHAGGGTHRKGLDLLAAAWREVAARHPDVSLVMTGPTAPARARFDALPRACFLGHVDGAALAGLMAGAEGVVVSSRYEGWGMPAAEALAAGTAVVACDVSSLPEVVGDVGILVAPEPAAVAAGMDTVLRGGPSDEREVRARRGWAGQFSWDATVTRHLEAYEACFDSWPPGRGD